MSDTSSYKGLHVELRGPKRRATSPVIFSVVTSVRRWSRTQRRMMNNDTSSMQRNGVVSSQVPVEHQSDRAKLKDVLVIFIGAHFTFTLAALHLSPPISLYSLRVGFAGGCVSQLPGTSAAGCGGTAFGFDSLEESK